MPIYTYQCDSCGETIEKYQPFDSEPLTKCPNCELDKLKRKIQPVVVKFTGNGFYQTDNRESDE